MDMSTIGRPLEDFLKRCPQCNRKFDEYGSCSMMYSSCKHVVCWNCQEKFYMTCPVCRKSSQSTSFIPITDLSNERFIPGCRVLTQEELEKLGMEKCRLEYEVMKANKEISRTKQEDQEKIELEKTRCEDKIKELEMEKNAAIVIQKEDQDKMKLFEDEIEELKMEKKAATELKKGCFSCNECDFLVAEYRSRICVDCGLSSGFLTKEDQNLRLNADTQQIEKENLMCVGCAVEGVHAGHQTVNYQQLKLEPISIEKKKAKDTELAEKRDTVVNSQTMITVARLLQTARVELSKLSEETVNAVTWDEFNSTWNSADIELSRAHSITENFLNVADDTEKSLEKVVAGLGAIRTGCKVFVKNSGKRDISEGANRDEIKTDCSASVITDASEWEALTDSSGKADQN